MLVEIKSRINKAWNKAVTAGRQAINAAHSVVEKIGGSPTVKTVTVAVGAILAGGTVAQAQSTPDASTIVTTASTTFNTVGALVASAVGFFIIVKIVKWIRK